MHRGVVSVGYNVQASVDAKNKLITHFDNGDVNDIRALAPVAIATKELLEVKAIDVLADKGYHTGEQLAQCISENINTFVSPKEPASNDEDIFPVTAFIYNPDNDTYTCPAGETLSTNGTWLTHSSKNQKSAHKFQRYNTRQCATCSLQPKCTKSKTNGRNIDRSEFATAIEQNNKRVLENPNYYRQRQQLAEHPWGTIKRQRGFDHVLTKGKTNVLGKVSLIFIDYNLARCASILKNLNAFKVLTECYINTFISLNSLILSSFRSLSHRNPKMAI